MLSARHGSAPIAARTTEVSTVSTSVRLALYIFVATLLLVVMYEAVVTISTVVIRFGYYVAVL
jgi:hypothetical protein